MRDQARALRRAMTEAEKLMWSKIRDRRLDGVKFKRQKPIAGYIVDFVALDLKLIVEIDGGQHAERAAEDAARTKVLEESGYHIVRFVAREPGKLKPFDEVKDGLIAAERQKAIDKFREEQLTLARNAPGNHVYIENVEALTKAAKP